jgi:hypothetical protein
MKRRLIFYGVIVAVIALVQFRPILFKTRAERYIEASAAADREFETLNRLHFERAAIGRGERLEPKLAAQFFAAKSDRAKAMQADSLGMSTVWQGRRVIVDARLAEAQAEIDREIEAIDRQIVAQSVRANEAARVQKSLEPEK